MLVSYGPVSKSLSGKMRKKTGKRKEIYGLDEKGYGGIGLETS